MWREPIQLLEPAGEILGGEEVCKMCAVLRVAFIMKSLDGCVLDREVHPLDLPIGPRVVRLCQALLHPVPRTKLEATLAPVGPRSPGNVETHLPRPKGVPNSSLLGELNAVSNQDRMAPVAHDLHKVLQELPDSHSIRFFNLLTDCKSAGVVNGSAHEKLALRHLHLSDVDVEEADRVAAQSYPN